MYLMVETIRVEMEDDSPERKAAREAFKTELGEKDSERTMWPLALQIYSVCVCVYLQWLAVELLYGAVINLPSPLRFTHL